MFKKSDTLPLILASGSTMGVLLLGYGVLTKLNFVKNTQDNKIVEKNVSVSSPEENSSVVTSAVSFSAPGIVPMGISVKINGATKMKQINKLLKRSFQREFPGTTVTVGTDGSETAIRLLVSGQVDLAALTRPLNEREQGQGLTAVRVSNRELTEENKSTTEDLFYAYREPANSKVEAFLGHLFSVQGQEAMLER
ncbi:substrate-binding domain-containing protein [Waterburya agarophytonicola K14]|uniref:Substrate-binding domain-containing protein n=1 Tax=Waterburya agarophytonicola KI4 TaxID=2874699 RepID=A0A964BLT9_9CYAN|nr:substrate-binding domain-containing protein [Waterburya agarophytonicola]MCC0175759.1 substrate-binding domain-containing protein [Waterburya agarophytonicola KI4]